MSDLEEEYESELEGYFYEELDEEAGEHSKSIVEKYTERNKDPFLNDFARLFIELQKRQFESADSRNAAIDELLNGVEEEYFLSKLKGGLAKKLLQKLVGGVVPRDSLKNLKGRLALIRVTAKEPLRGALLNVITIHPALAPARPLLRLLGLSKTAKNENSLNNWKEFVKLSRIMYENIINNMNKEVVDDPVAANRLAYLAFADAACRIRFQSGIRSHIKRRIRRIYLRPGERIIISIRGFRSKSNQKI